MIQIKEIKDKKGRRPDYTGDGVAVWRNTDKNGKEYLAVQLVGHSVVSAFLPREKA